MITLLQLTSLLSSITPADSNIKSLDLVEIKAQHHVTEDQLLKSKSLLSQMGKGLGEQLENQNGFANRSMGGAPSRPVYRGLGGSRLVISQNNSPIIDLSSSSPDHALAAGSSGASSVIHYSGPAALARFAKSSAGILEIHATQEFPLARQGEVRTAFNSTDYGWTNSLSIVQPLSSWAISGNTEWDQRQNYHSPSQEIKNTSLDQRQGTLGVIYRPGAWQIKNEIQGYTNEYEIPGGFIGGHNQGVQIEMSRQAFKSDVKYFGSGFWEDSRIEYQSNQYKHLELENNLKSMAYLLTQQAVLAETGIHFLSDTLTWRVRFHQQKNQYGGIVLTFPSQENELLSTLLISGSKSLWNYEISGLAGIKSYHSLSASTQFTPRNFPIWSGAFQLEYETWGHPRIRLSSIARAPEADELYNQGPHLAAWSYDLGDAKLPLERAQEIEFHTDLQISPILKLEGSTYYRQYESYLMMENTGRIHTRNGSNLPIWQLKGIPAEFWGGEINLSHQLTSKFNHELGLDYVYAQSQGGHSLPLIPPPSAHWSLTWKTHQWEWRTQIQGALAAKRLGAFESSTPDYLIANTQAQNDLFLNGLHFRILGGVENIWNQKWQNHLSRIKSVYPEKGRNFKVALSWLF